ncbi:MAG: arginine--tRNA ligase [Marine Group II euryarchaeote MED-G38]|nr:arginine--tRNA ligase [Euryarchaeota archaeon]OUV27350.1 MAG: arginine--tRNA ligase [Euryarchaeota archaeon TMED97]PDH22821.1 MAG: arginine--tRNA ligase [Marine Group II euryarchaeote MED-G38]
MSSLNLDEQILSELLAPATTEGHADLAIPCHSLSKIMKRSPVDISEEIVSLVSDDILSIAKVSSKNGFVNISATNNYIETQISRIFKDERLGVVYDHSRTFVVDYSAPNVAKEMHVGHLRSTVIGDSIVRLLSFKGYTVYRENHIGDWGTPFGMLIEHLLDLGEDKAAKELGVGDLDSFYKQARSKFNTIDNFASRSRNRVVMLQGGDKETLRLWKILVSESMRYFNEVYSILGVLLSDSDIKGESSYHDLLPVVIDRLSKSNILVNSEGAEVVFPIKKWLNREGDEMPVIIRKGDGGYNYSATDLACIIDRTERLNCTDLIYVVGTPQKQHFEMVFDIAQMAGFLHEGHNATHVNFGSVLNQDGKILKSREGNTIKLVDLLSESISRAKEVISEKNPNLSINEKLDSAKMIGIGAVKYADLSTERTKDYVFDWDKMLSFEGNTAPYLQYAHARICSIFSKSDISSTSLYDSIFIIIDKEEELLAKRLLSFANIIEESIITFSPHKLCNYLHSLASSFASFYENCPVLKNDNKELIKSRLALCDLTGRTLKKGLELLGIDSPEKM